MTKRATSFEPEVAKAFGSVVRAERNRLAIAQDQFALLANVDRSYFGKLERGERQPSLALMLRVARGLGCTGAELVSQVEMSLGRAVVEMGAQPPAALSPPALRALNDHLGDASLALRIDRAVRESAVEGWREKPMQARQVRHAIRYVLSTGIPADSGLCVQQGDEKRVVPVDLEEETDALLEIVKRQIDY